MFMRMLLILFLFIASIKTQATQEVCPVALQPGILNLESQRHSFFIHIDLRVVEFIVPKLDLSMKTRFPVISFDRAIEYNVSFEADGFNHTIKINIINSREDELSHKILIERLLDALVDIPWDFLRSVNFIMVYNYNEDEYRYDLLMMDEAINLSSEAGLYSSFYDSTKFKSLLLNLIEEHYSKTISNSHGKPTYDKAKRRTHIGIHI